MSWGRAKASITRSEAGKFRVGFSAKEQMSQSEEGIGGLESWGPPELQLTHTAKKQLDKEIESDRAPAGNGLMEKKGGDWPSLCGQHGHLCNTLQLMSVFHLHCAFFLSH